MIVRRKLITFLLFAVAAVFIVAGIVLKQPSSVLSKAIRICMECVGIG